MLEAMQEKASISAGFAIAERWQADELHWSGPPLITDTVMHVVTTLWLPLLWTTCS